MFSNSEFLTKIASDGGLRETQGHLGTFVRDRLREDSFGDAVLKPRNVNPSECQRSVDQDTLYMLVEVEPKSRAYTSTIRGGRHEGTWIRGRRMAVSFYPLKSPVYQAYELELMVNTMPITKIIEQNLLKDMGEAYDRQQVLNYESVVQQMQADANNLPAAPILNAAAVRSGNPPVEYSVRKGVLARAATTQDATVRPVSKVDINDGIKMFAGRRLRCTRVLLTDVDHADVNVWTMEDVGSKVVGEVAVNGWTYNTFLGIKYIRTIKTDILKPGNLFFTTDEDFLGKAFMLSNPQFFIKKEADLIQMQTYCYRGSGIVNSASICKIELYSCDATANNADSLLGRVSPVAEDQLGMPNNKLDAGIRSPQISVF